MYKCLSYLLIIFIINNNNNNNKWSGTHELGGALKKYRLQQETDRDTKNQRRMTEEERGEEIPSYRDTTVGES